MGLNEAFTSNANFELLSNIKPLFINEIIHKIYLDINETGITASSTSMVDFLGLESDSKPIEICDRPYLFSFQFIALKLKIILFYFHVKLKIHKNHKKFKLIKFKF